MGQQPFGSLFRARANTASSVCCVELDTGPTGPEHGDAAQDTDATCAGDA
ncbi:hypothetical protein ACFQ6E_38465 [Streptomyces sp. NPDC056462]